MSHNHRILISGAGIAGPALALLLQPLGHQITIIERAPDLRTSGQQIDISGQGLKVLRHLDLMSHIAGVQVHDDGIKFVDSTDKTRAAFPVSKNGSSASPVKEYEILRPDLAQILYDRTKSSVEYVFGDHITGITQHDPNTNNDDPHTVEVTFAKSPVSRTFDLVVAADGLRSSTRNLAFGPTNTRIHTLGMYAGFFSIPWEASDSSWSRWYNAAQGRCVSLRPNTRTRITGAYLCQCCDDSDTVATMPAAEQMAEIARRFEGAGWETERVLQALRACAGKDFYVQEIAQTKSDKLVAGRVVLVGDAGYCPSPVSGQGTTLAIEGAYVLAGCIASHGGNLDEALRQYEKDVAPFVKAAQSLPPGVPWIVNPQTVMGVRVLNGVLGVADLIVSSGVGGLLQKVFAPLGWLLGEGPKLRDYPGLKRNSSL